MADRTCKGAGTAVEDKARPEESTLFLLAGWAVSSAGNLVTEPRAYGPYRLLQMARRICDASEDMAVSSRRLAALGQRIDEVLETWAAGEDAFLSAAQALVPELVSISRSAK